MKMDSQSFEQSAELLKALAHPVRLCIVNGLLNKGSCNVSFMQDCLGLPQSTVSQHLQKLRSAGIVQANRIGLEVNYTVADERVRQLAGILFKEDSE
ncbi:metalloregulator ArsR/SmtB family transcription factor [Paenibacillus pasadenensis]|uniref:ArsR/SmtB family transcription factor n=1 Tax=Paenibacillus pasadenensis TaxID=217090 RepID=UPI00203A74C7|nr:metalloregulator ArsR/SmtB family transcription factor [Paenibacillus pasadenensis]MCM3746578.1 metalloregulator ArsR/SmtB family transcription factor [Paenibacillus pasadenensis]